VLPSELWNIYKTSPKLVQLSWKGFPLPELLWRLREITFASLHYQSLSFHDYRISNIVSLQYVLICLNVVGAFCIMFQFFNSSYWIWKKGILGVLSWLYSLAFLDPIFLPSKWEKIIATLIFIFIFFRINLGSVLENALWMLHFFLGINNSYHYMSRKKNKD
jgi:hypothetical protein